MADLDAFLSKSVERYLFKDIRTLKAAQPLVGETDGAAGYPLLMTAFAGIELLGILVSTSQFDSTQKDGVVYFADFWRNYLYPTHPSRRDAGVAIYKLARHGLDHAFIVKGNLEVVKGDPRWHLVRKGPVVSIDAAQLADDLETAYHRRFKPLLGVSTGQVTRVTIAARLDDIERDCKDQADRLMHHLRLPNGPNAGPVGPAASQPPSVQGASGSAFQPNLKAYKSTP